MLIRIFFAYVEDGTKAYYITVNSVQQLIDAIELMFKYVGNSAVIIDKQIDTSGFIILSRAGDVARKNRFHYLSWITINEHYEGNG